ncbi:MAG: hypothetical protein A3J24_05240 [Deltaproteobacteria bacterium RIFCSPLOWO2_02_FULL_53_8]|nr:MAG: hypothetical protein A3J24_05240 [Deltaproteobacteria bacterium RIFCSPLOWO2_02_FULL_53_8]
MKIRYPNLIAFYLMAAALLYLVFAAHHAYAKDNSAFRAQFTGAYQEQKLTAMVQLIKDNKEILPSEVNDLVAEALSKEKTFEETISLLDVANVLATMNIHWNNGDAALLAKVEEAQDIELRKEEERRAQADRWLSYEKLPGNFVMTNNEAAITAAGLAPVLFSHWRHNFYYDCKACHDSPFKMLRNDARITQKAITEGAFCGRCHNGTQSFSADKECEKCHAVGRPQEKRLTDISAVDLAEVETTAKRVGANWNISKLKGGKLPLDKFGFINWEELREGRAYSPVSGLEKEADDKTQLNIIVFKAKVQGMKSVLFNHEHHSTHTQCASCHQTIFKDKVNGNDVSMNAIGAGKFCGTCHGKAAFKLADCNRCHTITPGENPPEGARMRE